MEFTEQDPSFWVALTVVTFLEFLLIFDLALRRYYCSNPTIWARVEYAWTLTTMLAALLAIYQTHDKYLELSVQFKKAELPKLHEDWKIQAATIVKIHNSNPDEITPEIKSRSPEGDLDLLDRISTFSSHDHLAHVDELTDPFCFGLLGADANKDTLRYQLSFYSGVVDLDPESYRGFIIKRFCYDRFQIAEYARAILERSPEQRLHSWIHFASYLWPFFLAAALSLRTIKVYNDGQIAKLRELQSEL
ncbi:hypothetical protein [Rhodopseudomonas sp.]|uniref:hypothetical protein n=1 Tax=Rhodopseudomonas sp. TaxID=1078 RepID=UPI0039E2D99C